MCYLPVVPFGIIPLQRSTFVSVDQAKQSPTHQNHTLTGLVVLTPI